MTYVRALTVLVLMTSACMAPEDEDFETMSNATTPSGVSGAILSRASITEVEVEIDWEEFEYKIEGDDGHSVFMTIQSVTAVPGGHTGWHTHAGPTVAMITSGSVVVYRDADLSDCQGRAFTAGQAFMDGPDFGRHIARNEGTVDATVHIMHYLPAATTPLRIDVPAPAGAGACGLPQ